jgi:hypothetical protein
MTGLAEVARIVHVVGQFLGSTVPVEISIENSYRASLDFSLFGSVYTFTIERWAKRGLAGFLQLFHTVADRDPVLFGIMIETPDGTIQFYESDHDILRNPDGTYTVGPLARAMTKVQKLNCIERGCLDIFTCLDQIGGVHQRSILDYCVWYQEGHKNPTTYHEFITLVTSHSVVHNDLMAPNVKWQLVEFH